MARRRLHFHALLLLASCSALVCNTQYVEYVDSDCDEDGGEAVPGFDWELEFTPRISGSTPPPPFSAMVGLIQPGGACSGTYEFECFNYAYCDPSTLTCQRTAPHGARCDLSLGYNVCGPNSESELGFVEESRCAEVVSGSSTGLCVTQLKIGASCGNPRDGVCGPTRWDGDSECVNGICVATRKSRLRELCFDDSGCEDGLYCLFTPLSFARTPLEPREGFRCLNKLGLGEQCNGDMCGSTDEITLGGRCTLRDAVCGEGLVCDDTPQGLCKLA